MKMTFVKDGVTRIATGKRLQDTLKKLGYKQVEEKTVKGKSTKEAPSKEEVEKGAK